MVDNAVLASVEARVPIIPNLELTPFVEMARVWNNDEPDPDPSLIWSLGVGLRWRLGSSLSLRFDYGIPFVSAETLSNSLQDDGIHFSIEYRPF
ncbi:MAG: BamA/TamA family outer membrane protein [Chloroflexaceae bacterium]|nr:BamA/TamA family outer membrane protein [Chloroflexaceae bacterium]